MNDKEFCDAIHLSIHSVRLIPGYKPSELEKRISRFVIEKYKDTCAECKNIGEQIKNTPEQKSFLSKLGRVING